MTLKALAWFENFKIDSESYIHALKFRKSFIFETISILRNIDFIINFNFIILDRILVKFFNLILLFFSVSFISNHLP